MSRLVDLTGKTFGRWTVTGRAGNREGTRRAYWTCICACGTEKDVHGGSLMRGLSSSCGCLLREVSTKHGGSSSPTYSSWESMKQRCLNPACPTYAYYGGRGIDVDPRWVESFAAFREDMGERPEGKDLDRIDNSKGYWPDNCRWASRTEQMRNTRGNVVVSTEDGDICLKEAVDNAGIDYGTVRSRLRSGWDMQKAITTPAKAHSKEILSFRGDTGSLSHLSRQAGLKPLLVWKRLHRGWTLEQALITPSRSK